MQATDWIVLFAVMSGLAALPSTSVALVTAGVAARGFGYGAATAAGIVVGDILFVVLAVLGLGAVAEALGGLFVLVRIAAGAYLIWFGAMLVRSRDRPAAATVGRLSHPGGFLAGLFVTLGDVKAILFYAALFPVLVDVTALGAAEIAGIGVLTAASVGGVKLLYAWFAHRVALRAASERFARAVRTATGAVLVAVGTLVIARP